MVNCFIYQNHNARELNLVAVPTCKGETGAKCARFEEVKEKSSLYGLDMLGYTRATMLKTIGCDNVN